MAALLLRGVQKPLLGAQIDLTHPLGAGLRMAFLFNEGRGVPLLLKPSGLYGNQLIQDGSAIATWKGTINGTSYNFVNAGDFLNIISTGPNDGLPTGDCTVAVIRRKTDTTIRAANLFGTGDSTVAKMFLALVPNSDSKIYWWYGGNSGDNALVISGLSFPTVVERWIFTAGAKGMAVWRDGVKLASQANAVTRTASATNVFVNHGWISGGDPQEYNFFQVVDQQWSDDLCRWWSAEPYAHFYPGRSRTVALIGATAVAAASPSGGGRLGLLGVG